MPTPPFPQSYWVHDRLLCAGQYPGGLSPAERDKKLTGLLDYGIRRIVNLIPPDETGAGGQPFAPYLPRFCELAAQRGAWVEWVGVPTRDAHAPTPERMREILAALDDGLRREVPTYLHCWGGHGRTGTVVACHLIGRGMAPRDALARVLELRKEMPKNHDPFEGGQRAFVLAWAGR